MNNSMAMDREKIIETYQDESHYKNERDFVNGQTFLTNKNFLFTLTSYDTIINTYSMLSLMSTLYIFIVFFLFLFVSGERIEDDVNNLLMILSIGHLILDSIIVMSTQAVTTLERTINVLICSIFLLIADAINVILRFFVLISCLLKKDSILILGIEICKSLIKQIVLIIPVSFSLFFTVVLFYQAYSKRMAIKRNYLDYETKNKKRD